MKVVFPHTFFFKIVGILNSDFAILKTASYDNPCKAHGEREQKPALCHVIGETMHERVFYSDFKCRNYGKFDSNDKQTFTIYTILHCALKEVRQLLFTKFISAL